MAEKIAEIGKCIGYPAQSNAVGVITIMAFICSKIIGEAMTTKWEGLPVQICLNLSIASFLSVLNFHLPKRFHRKAKSDGLCF